MNTARVPPFRRLSAAIGGAAFLAALPLSSALAYLELTPQLEAGVTYEDNPRYVTDQSKAAREAADPGATANVMGNYVDARLEGVYRTLTDQISLTPRIRKTGYLKANQDLNNDDWYVDLSALHGGTRGNINLSASYQETGVRTSEFDSATPDNPDDPAPVRTGSGRFSDSTQQTLSLQPSLNYQISPRNIAGLSASFSDTRYDQRLPENGFGGYLDYTYSSTDLSLRHYLNAKNSFSMTLTGGNFVASQNGSSFENSTDSFGINASYDHTFSETLSGNATVGVSRNSVNVSGIVSGFDPLTGFPCSADSPCRISNEERNFIGNIGLRRRSELTTMNLSVARQIAPRSDGTEVVQDQLRFFVVRQLTARLSGSLGTVASQESAVGRLFQRDSATILLARQDRTFISVDSRVSWSLTPTLSTFGSYTYVLDKNNVNIGNDSQATNNRLYIGFLYRGIGFRR